MTDEKKAPECCVRSLTFAVEIASAHSWVDIVIESQRMVGRPWPAPSLQPLKAHELSHADWIRVRDAIEGAFRAFHEQYPESPTTP